jgi:exopolyphosphatase / guanosine-5'-triphosphate,3'-diphosphate pyrophosphatase
MARKNTLPQPVTAPAVPAPAQTPRPIAVVDMGASAIRLTVAEGASEGPLHLLEEVSRGVLLGKDTFTHGRLGAATMDATLKALEGFRRIMDTYGVIRYRAVATSAVREASNADAFLDRVRLRTGLEVEVIDGSEENRLTYLAVRERLAQHPALVEGDALLVEVGGGSADISFLRKGQPINSGTYPLGSIRMRQSLGSWQGSHEQGTRLLVRQIHNVVDDIRREMPLREARHVIALGGDVRFAAAQIVGDLPSGEMPVFDRDVFIRFVDSLVGYDTEQLVEKYRLPQSDAETLVPALLAYRELLVETAADRVTVPDASLRMGLLLDLVRSDQPQGIEDLRKQVLSSATALGERYRYDAPHARNVADLAVRLFEELRGEHGLSDRHRLLLEVAALLHDIGNYVNIRGHHKHSQYLIAASEIFGLSQDEMLLVSNVARYHRRAVPSKSHLPYMALDREARVAVNKLSALLRLANALDADHLQKIKDVHVLPEDDDWVLEVEGAGDLTLERLASLARADYLTEVFGRKVTFRETRLRPWP